MGLMAESDPRFANLERRVGIFLLTSALIVVAAVAIVGLRQDLFTPKTAIVFLDDSGRDLVEGMEVFTRGFRIGKVRRVKLNEEGKVEVTLAIKSSLFKWVRRDSTARLAAKAFIGDTRVEISPGTPQAPPMEPDGVIEFVRDPDITDVAKKVMEDVKPVLLEIKSLIEYVSDPQGDVKRTVANVNQLTAGLLETRVKLDETLTQVGARASAMAENLEALSASLRGEVLPQVKGLVGEGERLVGDAGRTARSLDAFVREDLHGLTTDLREGLVPQLRTLLAEANRAAAAAGSGAERVNRDLPAILGKVDASLDKVNAGLENVRAITEQLVPAAGEAAGVLRQGGELVEDTQALVRRTGELWPFRTGTRKPGTTVDVDSYQIESRPDAGGAPGPGAR